MRGFIDRKAIKRWTAILLALAPMLIATDRTPAPISPDELRHTVLAISSDTFEGRAPGTAGEEKTVDYLVARLRALGLEPAGPDGAWTQNVPLVHATPGVPRRLEITIGAERLALENGRDIASTTVRETDRVLIDGAPLVFVGYGVSAPERHWDDFKGVDLHGKIAVFLINDPDFEAQPGDDASGRFGGAAMTYYGRWTYKFEEAARQGAIGALVIHETAAAGWGWPVALSTVLGGSYALPLEPGQAPPPLMQGFLSEGAARAIIARAGYDLTSLKVRARAAAFRPVTLGDARLFLDMPVTSARIESRNVLAKIQGRRFPDETVMYGAHWDGVGVGKPDAEGHTVRAGANDDALGVASLLALARRFMQAPRPSRTILFGFWTAEERGLLGSEYYASHPTARLDRTVANLTIDTMQTAGPSRDVVQIGAGQNSLDGDLTLAASGQQRFVTPDAKPERGLFYRADHFSFAKRGVPTLLIMGIGGGVDLVDGGRIVGERWVNDYTSRCYHQPCDRWNEGWDLRGAVEDVGLFEAVGRSLSSSRIWPSWNAGSEFEAIRRQTDSSRDPGGSARK